MDFVVVRFLRSLSEWAETGRLPREELRIRWWIAVPGAVVVSILVAGLIDAAT